LFAYGYPACHLTFITSQSKEWAFICLDVKCVGQQSDTQLAFRNVLKGGSYYWVKNISGKIWFFQNYCRTIYPMFLRTFFSKNDDCVRETKIVQRKKNTVKVKQAPRKVPILQMRGNHMGKRRQNAKFRIFYWKSRGETNSIRLNKSVIYNRTFFWDNFFLLLLLLFLLQVQLIHT
jgi:hypothetical protein